ncbi:flagellar motor protein MotB [Jhaorihella thermophila]|uniref:Chemotaxis protein MotB n=1 Tax=Jhaorihella thermophila TaxID=488547 RepID=A0A1H5XPU4_9RHOB|nr:flagellar motor protein MotB [Jhaorihella thermophila]SEG13768.1 chemotaxis protein MotB [Jhaorihella thermophila]
MGRHTNAAPVVIKRKKVVSGDGHHGGAWKVAYADFVTAMMAFFMLMWLLNATTEKQRKGLADFFSPKVPIARVSGGGEGAFGGESLFADQTMIRDGIGATDVRATAERAARGASGQDLQGGEPQELEAWKAVEDALNGRAGELLEGDTLMRHVETRITDEGLIIELFDTEEEPLFEDGTDRPTALMKTLIGVVAEVSEMVVNGVAVEGHTRSQPVVLADNPVWPLSAARAMATRRLLEKGGMEPDRIKRVTGHADRTLAVPNPMAARNNRVEIILLREGL